MATTTRDLCGLRRDVLGHVGSKWSALVLTLLAAGPRRYSEIRRSCQISQRMLSLTLHELDRDGLVARGAGTTHYELTPVGRSLVEHINSLVSWADRHHDQIVGSRDRHAAAAASASALSAGRGSSPR